MPVQECEKGGLKGYKYGEEGKCYTYSNESEKEVARNKALRQARAIKANKEA